MKAVIQRVKRASVTVNGESTRSIGKGLMILLGVQDTDDLNICEKLAKKCAELRIFEDEQGKLNLSAQELGLSALVVSNFTLYADTKKGRRPSFVCAAKPRWPTAHMSALWKNCAKPAFTTFRRVNLGQTCKLTL